MKLILFLILLSCQHASIKKQYKAISIEGNSLKETQQVANDLQFLNQISPEYFNKLREVKAIRIEDSNCSHGQIACVFPNTHEIIFLNRDYLKLTQLERVSTLIHEVSHHKYGYNHVPCRSTQITNKECDETLASPFGEEYQFLKSIRNKVNVGDSSYLESVRRIKVRINSFGHKI